MEDRLLLERFLHNFLRKYISHGFNISVAPSPKPWFAYGCQSGWQEILQFALEVKTFVGLEIPILHIYFGWNICRIRNCETQPPASIGWIALSSMFVVRPASVTSPLISTIWCFRAYKPYIFCEDMILATCQCQHIFCCWVEPSLLLSSSFVFFLFLPSYLRSSLHLCYLWCQWQKSVI